MPYAMTLAQIRAAIKAGPNADEIDRLLKLLTKRKRSARENEIIDQLLDLKFLHMALEMDPFEDADV